MKKVIEMSDLCCKKCAERAEKKLLLLGGVTGARANLRKNVIYVETELEDGALEECLTAAGFEVVCVRERRGIFG